MSRDNLTHFWRTVRTDAFCALSGAASRSIDLRYAAAGTEPGGPAKVRAADARTTLDDRRIAHTLACWPEVSPNDLTPLGLIPADVSARIREQRAAAELCADGHRPDDDPEPGDRCKDCRRDLTWVGPSHLDWALVDA